jgi:hypothetical protein
MAELEAFGNDPSSSTLNNSRLEQLKAVQASLPDPNPDPPDPCVFLPPGSGSLYHHAKIRIRIIRKTSNPTIL